MTSPRRQMQVLPALLVAATAVAFSQAPAIQQPAGAPKADPKDWIQLFNGKDLKDWTPKFAKRELGENYNDTFRVEDGLFKVRYDKWSGFNGEFGHIFY